LTPTRFNAGADLDAIEAGLREDFGEPASSITEIGEVFEPHCYNVDRFDEC
jgi:hypothetical protein